MSRPRRSSLLCVASVVVATLALAHPKPADDNSAIEPAERTGGPAEMHKEFLKRAEQGHIDLLFLGDSITQGWAGGGREVWKRFYEPRHAANFGIGGDRTQHVLWRLDHGEVDGIQPKVAVLMIGTNNLGTNSPDEIVAGIKAIVDRVRKKLPDTKILLLAVFPRDETPSARRERIKSINSQIASLDDGKMIRYLDIGKHFLNDDDTISRDIMPDFLHLTSKGYRIWADAMEPTLWDMMERP